MRNGEDLLKQLEKAVAKTVPWDTLARMAFWLLFGAYILLPVITRGFAVDRLDCVPSYRGAVFLTFFAWIGYFGIAALVGTFVVIDKKEHRLPAVLSAFILITLFYFMGYLPRLLERCTL